MKTREQRNNELYSSGLVNSIKKLFSNRKDISEDYYVLMADYIDSMDAIKDQMLINPIEIAKKMPELVKSIQQTNLRGIYGRTDDNRIQMEQSLSYEDKKLYFFHELTHALQTSHENGREQCGFYDGHDGMFLTEGATQYTAEMLYHVSNGTNLEHRQQPRTVRGASDRNPNSPLSEYQYNGDILELLAKTMDLPLPQVLALAYKKDGREILKGKYESMEGNQGKFDELMNNLEKIYSIDKLLIYGYGQQLQSQTTVDLVMQNGTIFKGNLNIYKELMNKTERQLVATYIKNHNTEYILKNYEEIEQLLTTQDLKNNFLSVVHELGNLSHDNRSNNSINVQNYRRNIKPTTLIPPMPSIEQVEMPEGYSINKYGEIIRPARNVEKKQDKPRSNKEQHSETTSKTSDNKLSLKQKVAQFLQKHNLFMNMSFVKNFVHQQLDVLPPLTENVRESLDAVNKQRTDFDNWLTSIVQSRNLPPMPKSIVDPEKMAKLKRKMQQHTQSNDDRER